jgi:splicing factor 3B subunit 2
MTGSSQNAVGNGKGTGMSKRARRRARQKAAQKLEREQEAARKQLEARIQAENEAKQTTANDETMVEKVTSTGTVIRPKRSDTSISSSSSSSISTGMTVETATESSSNYVKEELMLSENPNFAQFQRVFQAFQQRADREMGNLAEYDTGFDDASLASSDDTTGRRAGMNKDGDEDEEDSDNDDDNDDDDEDDDDDDEPDMESLSNRKRKELTRLSIAELKQLVSRPDVVEVHDRNANDPKLLVHLKAYRNTVPVPRHWLRKRKYLQFKRGMEKTPFKLPQAIEDTGIAEVRSAQVEKDAGKSMSQQQRERMRPKMGQIDIDYQVLHDAFFRYQKKPKMTTHGDVYYEGRELETQIPNRQPGRLSSALMTALNMKDDNTSPPPWLHAMQRYGPPPSYPKLKVPGVNCPIPQGCRYGFGPNEWGRPPVDQYQRPLFGGDLFGAATKKTGEDEEAKNKQLWGALEAYSEGEEDDEDDEEDDDQVDDDERLILEAEAQREQDEAMSAASASAAAAGGIETPVQIQLRKDGSGIETPTAPRQLYQVLEQKSRSVGSNELFGTSHTYAMPSQQSDLERKREQMQAQARGQVDISLNPEELGSLDADTLQRKYQAQLDAQNAKKSTGSGSGTGAGTTGTGTGTGRR